jgi:hypothetical protein
MRVAWRAVSVVTLGVVLVGGYEGWRSYRLNHWRSYRLNHWKSSRGRADASACPQAKNIYGDCGTCVAAECCAEVQACYSKNDCIDLNDCMIGCSEEGPPGVSRADCPAGCEKRHAASVVPFHAWDDCARSLCGEVCPRETDEQEEEREKKR